MVDFFISQHGGLDQPSSTITSTVNCFLKEWWSLLGIIDIELP